jgi:glycosyltransferase involved in cell wall biosynthesis
VESRSASSAERPPNDDGRVAVERALQNLLPEVASPPRVKQTMASSSSMDPKISVIIPTYNRRDLVVQAIESVLAQSYADFEVVVVDDGSQDDTRSVICACEDSRVRYIYQENQGLSGARNTGINAARGEYVAFLDADDLFLPGNLASQVETLASRSDVGLAAGGHVFVDETGQSLAQRQPWRTHPNLDLKACLVGCPIVPSAVVVRHEWLDLVKGFNPALRRAEDADLWIRLAYQGCRIAWTPKVVSAYRIHSGQMVQDGHRQKEVFLGVLDEFFKRQDLSDLIRSERTGAFAEAYLSGACREYGANQVDDARQSLAKAIDLKPVLLTGTRPRLADILVAWAADPVTGEPTAFMQNVLTHLPNSAMPLLAMKQRLLYSAAIHAMVDAIEVENQALAREYAARAVVAGNSLSEDSDLLVELLVDRVRGLEMNRQQICITDFFASLPPNTVGTAFMQRKALGRLFMARSFACLDRGMRREARRWASQGVCHDPSWLRNRGVLSILVKPARSPKPSGHDGSLT